MTPRIVVVLALVAGCNDAPSNRVPRQAAAPVIAADPRLSRFIGDWGAENGAPAEFSITQNADGSATIRQPYGDGSGFDSVVNNARFDGDALRYDVYFYYTGDTDYHEDEDSIGDHPFSGQRNEVTLTVDKVTDTLTMRMGQFAETLVRHSGE